MKILLIAYHYPPAGAIAAQRTGAMAKHLARMGYAVSVITAAPATTKSIGASRPQSIQDPIRLLQALPRRILSRLLLPDAAVLWSLRVAIRPAPPHDVVLASGPPFSAFIAARVLSWRYGTTWVADYRDLWTASPYYRGGRLRKFLDRRIERHLLQHACGLTTVSKPLLTDLERQHGRSGAQVRNGFEPDDFVGLDPWRPTLGPLRIVYCGEIYEGKRDPTLLFRAAHTLGLSGADIRFEFYGSSVSSLSAIAAREGVESLVSFHPRVSHRTSLQLQLHADALLLLMWCDRREDGVYSGKIFEYLGAQRPVLIVGLESNVAAQLVREGGAGWVIDTEAKAVAALQEALARKAAGGPQPLSPPTQDLTRGNQIEALGQYLNSVGDSHV